jgi:hypothetical protein
MASQVSEVSAVRTARALRRAISMQLRIEDGFSGENARNSATFSSVALS